MSLRTVRAREAAARAKVIASRVANADDLAQLTDVLHEAGASLEALADAVIALSEEAEELELRADHEAGKKSPKPPRDVY